MHKNSQDIRDKIYKIYKVKYSLFLFRELIRIYTYICNLAIINIFANFFIAIFFFFPLKIWNREM